jgi:tetratricopeptide (TPR) repeat protein
MDLAEIYAAKGDRKRALAEASKAINELAVNTSSFALIRLRQRYLEILISMGEYREATRLIDELLTNPSAISVKIVENDRTFDPLRNIPEFKAILDKHSMKSGK